MLPRSLVVTALLLALLLAPTVDALACPDGCERDGDEGDDERGPPVGLGAGQGRGNDGDDEDRNEQQHEDQEDEERAPIFAGRTAAQARNFARSAVGDDRDHDEKDQDEDQYEQQDEDQDGADEEDGPEGDGEADPPADPPGTPELVPPGGPNLTQPPAPPAPLPDSPATPEADLEDPDNEAGTEGPDVEPEHDVEETMTPPPRDSQIATLRVDQAEPEPPTRDSIVPPIAYIQIAADPVEVGEQVVVDASYSYSPAGAAVDAYRFRVDGGPWSLWQNGSTFVFTAAQAGVHHVMVQVQDGKGLLSTNAAVARLVVMEGSVSADAPVIYVPAPSPTAFLPALLAGVFAVHRRRRIEVT